MVQTVAFQAAHPLDILRPCISPRLHARCWQAARRCPVPARACVSEVASTGEEQNFIVATQTAEPGTVYFVATPIGNLQDITLRAMNILRTADVIASEDTRTTGRLLQLLGIKRKEGAVMLSHHEHNHRQRVPELVERARRGAAVAVVSDAGTPGISDPGMELAALCADFNVPLVPVPGPCAAVAAVSVSGLPSQEFVFFGFLPSKRGSGRKRKLAEVAEEPRTCVLYEAPHRLGETLRDLLAASESDRIRGGRSIVCARELTKLHEEVYRGTVASALEHFCGPGSPSIKGEFTIVLGPRDIKQVSEDELKVAIEEKIQHLRMQGMSVSEVAKTTAKDLRLKRSEVYRLAIAMEGNTDPDSDA